MATARQFSAGRVKRFGLPLLAFCLGFPLVSAAGTGNDAMDWVQKMSRAMQELSYQGRFVYMHDDHVESMSILHVNSAEGKRERLISLNGEAREILRDNANLTCVWPSSRQVVVDPVNRFDKSPLWIPADVERLGKFYQFSIEGQDRIADHPAVIISIQPKDKFRYGMKVWIHELNGLLLQSYVFDQQGRINERVMFTDLSLMGAEDHQAVFDVTPKIANGYALIRSHSGKGVNRMPMDEHWRLQQMPVGFYIESAFRKRMPESSMVQQMILSDGMASVSVFIEKLEGEQLHGESSMGAINAYSTIHKGFGVTAIGEVPAVTVELIARSVYYDASDRPHD